MTMGSQLIKKIRITTRMELLSGLHIGGNGDNVEIGGIDNTVVKIATKEEQPYIPGSSLKGKMRCLLEQINGSTVVGGCEKINNLFGSSEKKHPSKIIVRDSYLTEDSLYKLKQCTGLDLPYTEIKCENSIDRCSGTANNPRQTERIPAGVAFDVEFIINVWDDDDEKDLFDLLEEGIKAMENDYLGGSGSRGYGQVKFGKREQKHIVF